MLIIYNKNFTKMYKKFENPKKELLRNVQVPLNSANGKIKVVKCGQISNDTRLDNVVPAKGPSNIRMCTDIGELQTQNDKYSKPELNTCVGLVKKMKDIKQMKMKSIETEGDLTPRSKQVYRHEITKVLNLPIDKKIYHHLIPLNVNDAMLMQPSVKLNRKKYASHTDLEPQLEDFLTEIAPIKMIFPMNEELDVMLKTNTRDHFDYLQNLYETFGPDSYVEE